MKKLLVGSFIVGLCYSAAFATYARIESMGKNSTYIMDDMSIFDNPANIGIYPNYLIGEMGTYLDDVSEGSNLDPQNPWFGGIFAIGIGRNVKADPRFSIAGAFNRVDQNLFRFFPDKIVVRDISSNAIGIDPIIADIIQDTTLPGLNQAHLVEVPAPATNFDGFLGLSTESGDLYGLHVYVAYQDGANEQNGMYQLNSEANASIIKMDAGTNLQLSSTIDAEIAVGVASMQYGKGTFIDWDNLSYLANARLFSTVDLINGELVPTVSYGNYTLPGQEAVEIQAGLGINVSMDNMGFFWLGLDFISNTSKFLSRSASLGLGSTVSSYPSFYNHDGEVVYSTFSTTNSTTVGKDVVTETGGKISFGIERSIWWDWFIIRVGGQKVITYVDCDLAVEEGGYCGEFTNADGSGNYMRTNVAGNGTNSDHIGFGFGINVEEKLKIDVTVSEDLLYRNPFSGQGRLFSRLSATYSF
ncbi:MAG: hypothetical protein OCD01_06625 [Fibrobacterales bacterium]